MEKRQLKWGKLTPRQKRFFINTLNKHYELTAPVTANTDIFLKKLSDESYIFEVHQTTGIVNLLFD